MSIAHIELILNNRRPHEVQAGVRFEVLERAVAEFKALAERICADPQPEGFEIDTRRDRPVHAELSLKRLERMRAEDAAAAGAQS